MVPSKSDHFLKIVLASLTILLLANFAQAQTENIWDIVHWEAVNHGGYAVLKRPDPAGIENGFVMYLCRAQIPDGSTRIGSLWSYSRRLYCRLSSDGEQFDLSTYDMLDEPPGACNWIPLGSQLPSYAIGGVETIDGKPGWACRGIYEDDLIVGTLFLEDMTCYAARSDAEQKITEGIEVLVLNLVGQYS